jgi:hypothetical protein
VGFELHNLKMVGFNPKTLASVREKYRGKYIHTKKLNFQLLSPDDNPFPFETCQK